MTGGQRQQLHPQDVVVAGAEQSSVEVSVRMNPNGSAPSSDSPVPITVASTDEDPARHYNNIINISNRTLQITINEQWIEGFQTIAEEFQDVIVDLVESLMHPFFMDPDTLKIFSTGLLVMDRFVSVLSNSLDMLVARASVHGSITSVGGASQTILQAIEEIVRDASWGLYFDDKSITKRHNDGAAINNCHSGNNSTLNLDWLFPWVGFYGDNSNMTVDQMEVSVLVTPVIVMAAVGAYFVNTSYFSTLMAPIYSRLMDSHSLTTEVLLALLLLLFGLETVTALSFFLLGYKLLSMHVLSTVGEDGIGDGVYNDSSAMNSNVSSSMFDEANIMLVLSTILWLVCVVTSKVVRMALYHSLGD
ncbi:hypothetical protein IV203_035264 [Nitzschia inconspicua]|uniref:Transmembrane protein n=1 Tax=Nitzschia inconspicua TaxID=303405 RepID=A0A9K3LE27_9STRA|nr:hypothetical protein IV203_035264 [Nitzschia inconspicua]